MSHKDPEGDQPIRNSRAPARPLRNRDKARTRAEQLQENARWIADLSKRTLPENRDVPADPCDGSSTR